MASLSDYIGMFNDGDWDEFSNIFGNDVSKFLLLFKRRGLLDQIDIDSVEYNYASLVNGIQLFMLENDPSYYNTIVKSFLSDVEVRNDGYYLRLRDLEELSEFFKDNTYSREYNDRDVVKNVLGEDWWEPYSDTVHDVYDDIVEVLNEKNMELLAERVLELVGNKELSLDDYLSQLFEDMSDDNNRFIITESNVKSVVEDKDSMNQLFDGDLDELKNQLNWLGDESYNIAYNDEVYKEVFDELSTYFVGKHDWVETKKGEKTVHTPYIKIKDINRDIYNFLYCFKGYDETLYEYGNYNAMVTHYMDNEDEWLTIRIPDYPDDRKVTEYINDGLPDRLYF
jgi:hypothetical protein